MSYVPGGIENPAGAYGEPPYLLPGAGSANINRAGLSTERPVAAADLEGTIWIYTETGDATYSGRIDRCDGTSWIMIVPPSSTYASLSPTPTGVAATDRANLQAWLDGLPGTNTKRGTLVGAYHIDAPLMFDSGVDIDGGGVATITQDTNNVHGLVSRNYISAQGVGPGGKAKIRNLQISLPAGSTGNCLVLRDYYSRIENVETSGGQDGIHLDHLNDVGGSVSGTLVENRIHKCKVRNFGRYGVYLGGDSNNKLTDGFLTDFIADAGTAGGTSYVYCGSSAGWLIDGVHGYGTITGTPFVARDSFNTNIDNIYLETAGGTTMFLFSGVQQALNIDNVTVVMPNLANCKVFNMFKSGAFSSPKVNIGNLHVVQTHAVATFVVSSDDTGMKVQIANRTVEGGGSSSVTLSTGSGAAGVSESVKSNATPCELGIAVTDETTPLTTGTAKVTFRMPWAMTLTAVRANLSVASSSGLPTIDVKESGVSIFSTLLTIDATETTSQTAATPAVLSDTALADDAQITVDINTAGTGAAGLKLWFIGTRVTTAV